MSHRLQFRRDTKARWLEINPILMEGEYALETDTKCGKIGDGVHKYSELEYSNAIQNITQDTSGQSETLVMSQKATINAIVNKIELSNIDLDITTIGKIIIANTPCQFVVMSNGKNVGILHCFSDNNQHMLTQVFTTHYLLPFSNNTHTDEKIYQYFRSYHLSGGTSSIPKGTWGEWKLVFSSENLTKNIGLDEYETFSEAKEYPAGYTLLKDGLLYTFTTDHAAGAWNPDEVEDGSIKKDFENKLSILNKAYIEKIEPASTEDGYYINLSGEKLESADASLLTFDVEEEENYSFIGKSRGPSSAVIAFYDTNNNFVSYLYQGDANIHSYNFTIPQNVKKVIITFDKSYKNYQVVRNQSLYTYRMISTIKGTDFEIKNKGINYITGALTDYTGWITKDFSYIPIGINRKIKVKAFPGTNFRLAFYKKNVESTFISGTKDYILNNFTEIDVPSNAQYFRIGIPTIHINRSSIEVNVLANDILKDLSGKNEQINNLQDSTTNNKTEIENIKDSGTSELELSTSDFEIQGNGINYTNGKLTSYVDWVAKDYTYMGVGVNRKMKVKAWPGSSFGLAFYSAQSEDAYISGTKDFNNNDYTEINIPDDALYFRIGTMTNKNSASIVYPVSYYQLDKSLAIIAGTDKDVKKLKSDTEKLKSEAEALKQENVSINENLAALQGQSYSGASNAIGKLYISSNEKIVLSGASFAYNANGWFELMCSKLGVEGLNKAVSGSKINDLAVKLYNKSFVTDEEFSQIGIFMIMHVHNYDVYTLPEKYENFTCEDYENEDSADNIITNGSQQYTDLAYAKSYDYVIKKWFKMNQDLKSAEGTYNGTTFGRSPKIILCTHWHDGRQTFNNSVRKLSQKWGIPLVRFDDNIGMSSTAQSGNIKADDGTILRDIVQFALQSDEGGKTPTVINGKDYNTEKIDGVILPWHQDRGQDKDIQKRMAYIAKELIEVV